MPKKTTSTKVTTCAVCGQPIEYKTKKPDKCNQCKKVNTTPRSPRTKWKKETEMIRIMNKLLPGADSIVNGYYSWLLSPKNMPLQLDWYCPDYKIAVEFNGIQHYTYTKYFHKTKKEFAYQQECDALKAKACRAKGITLLSIEYGKVLSMEYMASELQKANPVLYEALIKGKKLNIGG